MKIIPLLAMLLALGGGVWAAPSATQKADLQARRRAIELFEGGQAAAAVTYLRGAVAADSGADGATTALVRSLIEIANGFYNQRRLGLAKDAAVQASAAAGALTTARSSGVDPRRASLLSSLGLVSEEIERDYGKAESLYAAAAVLEPANPTHAARKQAVARKAGPSS